MTKKATKRVLEQVRKFFKKYNLLLAVGVLHILSFAFSRESYSNQHFRRMFLNTYF